MKIYLYNYESDEIEEMTLDEFRLRFNSDYINPQHTSLFFTKKEAIQRQEINRGMGI